MYKKSIISLTNKVSIVVVFLLLYWVFIFSVSMVFGFKVFKENLTETFFLAILGILALLSGAVIVNIMLNMTIISEAVDKKAEIVKEEKKLMHNPVLIWAFICSFPIIAMLLYFGDVRTSGAKERYLVKSATYLVENNPSDLRRLAAYSFDSSYVAGATKLLQVLSKQDESFPSMQVIVRDNVEGMKAFLCFGGYFRWGKNEMKADYIYSCSAEERKYLRESFDTKEGTHRFSAADGHYELYYPVKTDTGYIMLYFTDNQRYGKIGS
jgi:hypothetical protein